MNNALQLRLSQHLTLTPQLQQSIRLLQLSTLELQQELEQALQDNPMLERIDEPIGRQLSLDADGRILHASSDAGMTAPDTRADRADEAAELSDPPETTFDADDRWDLPGTERKLGSDDDMAPLQLGAAMPGLHEQLREQLRLTRIGLRDRALAEFIIGSLNDNGYLESSLEELQQALPRELDVDLDELQTVLTLVQSFEPAGVAARTPSECLLLQLRQRCDAVSPECLALAQRICRDHLSDLAQRDWNRLMRALGCNEAALREAHALILTLDPYPGSRLGKKTIDYVTPDVVVRRTRQGWVAQLNGDVLPRLRINQAYADILRAHRGQSGALGGQLQEARWLIRNVQQRFETIQRVAQAIVDRQRAFFQHGQVAMRPLVLREIADTLGLHESTISRVTTQKYMLTPFGTFELKYFFGSHVATDSGGAASSTAIRALIRQFIDAEDSRKPLSDSQLAQMLGEQGIVVARRTIAKYRESLRIPAVAQRKSL
jgi:RNA polymerase sigma-54 factor